MALAIVTADQRRAQTAVKGQIWGPAGVGKTTLLKTLDQASTLVLDFEAGLLAIERDDDFGPAWNGDSIKIDSWPEALSILEAFKAGHPDFAKYKTVFIDSTSFASNMCMAWCKTQPGALTQAGAEDIWAVYRMLSEQMCGWVKGWKFLPGVNVWLVGGLERKKVDGVAEWIPLLDGLKLYAELPYIMDYCFVMARFKAADGKSYRGIFTSPDANPEYEHVPLKSRVAGLAAIEEPHLGKLTAKALSAKPKAVAAPPPSSVPPAPGGDATPTDETQHSEAA